MAQLFTLMFGKSKKRMKPIMIDVLHKVENYRDQRERCKGSKASHGWHAIVPAENDAVVWRKNNSCQWTNYDFSGPRVIR